MIRHTGEPSGDSGTDKFKVIVAEATLDSFEGAQLDLKFTGIPDGVKITLDAWVATLDEANEVDDKKPDLDPRHNAGLTRMTWAAPGRLMTRCPSTQAGTMTADGRRR